MINYEDAEPISVMPPFLREKTDIIAISYAVKQGIKKLIEFVKKISVYAIIDELDDNILDLLALELKTQYYREDLNLIAKKRLIKNTLKWYEKAGTQMAVYELISAALGQGQVQEWMEYGGAPYTFKIITDAEMTQEANAILSAMIKNVKNTRSHLDGISITRDAKQTIYAGAGTVGITKAPDIREGMSVTRRVEMIEYAALGTPEGRYRSTVNS